MRVWLPAIRSGTGTDVFTVRLRDALIKNGVDARITWLPLWVELIPDFLKWVKVPPDTDLIHVNGWVGEAFLNRGVAVVVTVHHLVHDPAYAPFRSKAQKLYHQWHLHRRDLAAVTGANTVTAVSQYVADTVRQFSGRTDVSVIHNWVDTQLYSPIRDSSSPRPFRLLLAGNQSLRKGFDFLPYLAKQLGTEFEIRCTGGLRTRRHAPITNVRWLGRLCESSLISEYQQCDCVLSLSRYEGFGYTALEGMACGKPTVGFATSGLNEVATNDCGRLVPIGDINKLSAAIKTLKNDPELLANLGKSARHRAEKKFSEGYSTAKLLELYQTTIRQFESQR